MPPQDGVASLNVRVGDDVKITWLDSAEQPGWLYGKLTYKPKLLVTKAEVVAVSPTAISVAATISADGPEDGVLSPLTIPRGCIVRMERR